MQTSWNFHRVPSKNAAWSLQAVFGGGLIIPPGVRRGSTWKKKERKRKREREKKRSSRATHIKRELNVEISVSQRRKRDGDGGPALRFSTPLHWVFHPVEPCIYLYTDSSLVYKNSTPAFKRALKPGFGRVTVPRNYIRARFIYLLISPNWGKKRGRRNDRGRGFSPEKFSIFPERRRRRRRRAINIRIEFVNSPLNFSNLFRGNNLASCSTKNQKNALPLPWRAIKKRYKCCIFAGLRWNWVKRIGSILFCLRESNTRRQCLFRTISRR